MIYVYLLFLLFLVLTTNSVFALKTNLFLLNIAGVQNPLILLILIWLVRRLRNGLNSFPRTTVDWTIVAMFLASVLSSFCSTDPTESYKYVLITLLFYGLFYASYDLVDSHARFEHIITLIIMSGLVVTAYNLHYLYQYDFCSLGVLERYPFWTGKSPMGYYNTFLISFFLGLKLYGWKSRQRLVNIGLIALLVGATVSLFFSFSRSSWLTALIIVFFAGFYRYRHVFLIGSLVIVLVLVCLYQDEIGEFGLAIYNINAGNVDDRVHIWKSSLDMLLDHPFTGVGAGTFNINYLERYMLPESQRWNDSYHAHNVFLHIAAEQGYIGLITFLLFWGLVFRQIISNYHLLDRTKYILLKGMNTALLFSLSNYFLWSLTNTSLSNVTKSFFNINLLTWFLTALVFCIPRVYKQTDPDTIGI